MTEPTAKLNRLRRAADEAFEQFGLESPEYSAALLRQAREEDRLTTLTETPEARYVRTYRPY